MQFAWALTCNLLRCQALPDMGSAHKPDGGDGATTMGPLDLEKAELVGGMLQLVTATAGYRGSPPPRAADVQGESSDNNRHGDEGSCRASADQCSSSVLNSDRFRGANQPDADSGAASSADCVNSDFRPDITDFDRLEQRAAGRFIQVANAAAAAAYSARWACQPRTAAIDRGRARGAAAAAVRAAATTLQTAAQAMRQQMGHVTPRALKAARRTLRRVTALLPASLQGRAAALFDAAAVGMRRKSSVSNGGPDEWWRRDPNRRPSLWTLAGWRRRVADTVSALPPLQSMALTLTGAVPAFADVVLLVQKHKPLCVKQVLGAADAADAAGASHRRHC